MTSNEAKNGKMTDRRFSIRISLYIIAILICLFSLFVTTYALFTEMA